jgi:diguanylate cyclase (GGDEF)-like protein/PAS domain S-box-containing protein
MPKHRADDMPGILERVRRGERVQDYETVRVRKDGRRVVVSLRVSPIRNAAGAIVGASAIAREITEKKWAEQRLATQFAVTRILAEASALREAAPPLLGALCQGLDWDGGELWRRHDESGLLHAEARWTLEEGGAPEAVAAAFFPPGKDLAERAFRSGQAVFAEDLDRPPALVRTPDSKGMFRAVFAWPLRVGGQAVGALALYGREPRPPKVEMVAVMDDVASRIGQFIERERSLEGLRRLEKAVETVAIGVTVTDVNGRILYTNAAEAAMHGYAREELIGKHVRIFMPQEWRPASGRPEEIRSWKRETVNVRRDGTIFPVQLLSDAVTGPDGRPVAFVTCCEEITERKRAEEHLRSSEERYRLLFERNLAGVYRATFKGRLLECNEAFARILGYASREEVLARSVFDLFFDRSDREDSLRRLEEKGTLTNFELRMRRKDETAVWVLENETLLRGEDGEHLVEGTLIDITERKLAEKRIEFHAYHDPLTGLPNRIFLKDRLDVALAHARRSGASLAVMFLDLDRFKDVNDRLGHVVGDWLLQRVAERLRDCVREDDTVARLGGDEFVLLLPQVRQVDGATRVAAKIMARMESPFPKEGHDLRVTASIGIALFPQDGDSTDALLKNADQAMYRAKKRGRNAYELFSRP